MDNGYIFKATAVIPNDIYSNNEIRWAVYQGDKTREPYAVTIGKELNLADLYNGNGEPYYTDDRDVIIECEHIIDYTTYPQRKACAGFTIILPSNSDNMLLLANGENVDCANDVDINQVWSWLGNNPKNTIIIDNYINIPNLVLKEVKFSPNQLYDSYDEMRAVDGILPENYYSITSTGQIIISNKIQDYAKSLVGGSGENWTIGIKLKNYYEQDGDTIVLQGIYA